MPPTLEASSHPSQGCRRRWSPSFSLDEAARIRRMIREGLDSVECPQCASLITPMVGGDGANAVWLVRCESCERGMVIVEAGEVAAK